MKLKFRHSMQFIVLSSALTMAQVYGQGFIEDSKATLNARNFYFERNFTSPGAPQNYAREWTQGFIFDLRSGFTQGTIGFGFDVLGKYAVKLDGGAGHYGALLLPKDDDGEPADSFGRLGVAIKAKYSATELKAGEWMPSLPLVNADDFRALPQTFRGAQITSKEVRNLIVYGGEFTSTSLRNDSSMEDLSFGSAQTDAFRFLGADYQLPAQKTTIRLSSGQLKDIYQQQYVGLVNRWEMGQGLSLNTTLAYFWGKDDGSAKAGRLDNKTVSALIGLTVYQHTFSVGLQDVSGATGWMRIAGTGGIHLANNTYNIAFDNPKEKSWQIKYDLNFAGYGVPGLTLMTRYVNGDNVKIGRVDNGSEWVRETELAYVIQSGSLRDLSVRWRNSSVRRDFNSTDYDENRVIVSYPINIF